MKSILKIFKVIILFSLVSCSDGNETVHFDIVEYKLNITKIEVLEETSEQTEPSPATPNPITEANIYQLQQTILLHQNLLLSNPKMIPVSPHFILEHSYAVGDLTGNGLYDVALVFSECYEYIHLAADRRGTRHLFVLLANEYGGLEIAGYSDSVILHGMAAGRFGDGFENIIIENGVLSIHQIWGSSYSASGKICFIVQDRNLILHREEVTAFHSTVGNWYTTIYYPKTGKVEITAGSWHPYSESLPENGVLLFSHTAIAAQAYMLEDESFERRRVWRDGENWQQMELLFWGAFHGMYSQLPFGQKLGYITVTASDALTMAQQAYFPHLTRIYFMFDQEIINNFSLLLGFEIPNHFYTDGINILRHQMTRMQETTYDTAVLEPVHIFRVHDTLDMFVRPDYNTVRVSGETGEVTLARR